MKWYFCIIFGHRWERFGYPTKDDDLSKDDIQLFRCRRCSALEQVKHNGNLPRFVVPIHWKTPDKVISEFKDADNG